MKLKKKEQPRKFDIVQGVKKYYFPYKKSELISKTGHPVGKSFSGLYIISVSKEQSRGTNHFKMLRRKDEVT